MFMPSLQSPLGYSRRAVVLRALFFDKFLRIVQERLGAVLV
jgi:hypothetical protein